MFKQAFLLSQYSFICEQYFKCSDIQYTQYFFWWLVNKTADCFNNIVEINSKKVCEKMENNSMLEKVLLVFNRNAQLLRLVEATFYSKVASLRRMMKKNLITLKSLQKRKLWLMAIFCFVVVYIWVVKYQLKVFGTHLYADWTYLWQCCIWNFSQYYNNLSFIEQ